MDALLSGILRTCLSMYINFTVKCICLLLLSALGVTSSQAQQNVKFYLEPSGDFLSGSQVTKTEVSESSFISIWPISADSAYRIRTTSTFERSTTTKVEQSFGGGLRGVMQFAVRDRLSLRTGLGLRFERFNIKNNLDNFVRTITSSSDTLGIVANPTINGGGFTPASCITIYEGFNDFEDQSSFIPVYTNLLLEVPLALRYEVLPNKLGVSLGATVITPLRSTYEFTDYEFNVQDHPDAPEGVCATVISLATNTTGERTSDFQLAGEVSCDFSLSNGLRVVVSASQMFTDRFVQEEETSFFSRSFSGSYRPLRLSLGVQWQLGGRGDEAGE